METLIFVVVAAVIVWNIMLWWAQRELERAVAAEELLAELERRIPVGINIEEINGVVYGWDHKTQDFVCQGRDIAEFRTNFRARFPDRNAAIVDGPDELIARMKQEMKVINENLSSQ